MGDRDRRHDLNRSLNSVCVQFRRFLDSSIRQALFVRLRGPPAVGHCGQVLFFELIWISSQLPRPKSVEGPEPATAGRAAAIKAKQSRASTRVKRRGKRVSQGPNGMSLMYRLCRRGLDR